MTGPLVKEKEKKIQKGEWSFPQVLCEFTITFCNSNNGN